MLLEHKLDINAVDLKGNTPLHHAVSSVFLLSRHFLSVSLIVIVQGNEQCVKLLLEAGASTTIANSDGKTPRQVYPMETV